MVAIVAILATFYSALYISHKNTHEAESQMTNESLYLWLYRILVNNGLACQATWETVSLGLNLAIAIQYEWYRKCAVVLSLEINSI